MSQHKEVIKFGGMEIHFCLDANDTNEQLTMFKCIIHPNTRMPAPHYHEHFDETVYGLKGAATFTIGGKTIEIGPGDSYFIPRGTVHGFANKSSDTIEFLAFVSPGLFGPDYFKDIAQIVNAGGPPDLAKIHEVMRKYGLVPVAQ
ncbi:MAG: cupin domain-containing protein [Chitinophagaceae bacterium]|nr:cupin domain-containing protein [Chitinophagaceae bacterium]